MFRGIPFKMSCLAFAMAGMVACGDGTPDPTNNGGRNTGTGTGNAQTDTQTTQSQVQGTTQTGIQQAVGSETSLKFHTIEAQTVACVGGGTTTVTGEVHAEDEPITFNLDFDFAGCTVLDGTVNASGEIFIDQTSYSYNYALNGDVGGNGCSVNFNGFLIDIDIPDLTNPLSFSALIDGAIAGACTGGDTTCTYADVTIDGSGGTTGSVSCD